MIRQLILSVFVSFALASSSSLASSLGLGPLASSAINSVGASTGISGFSTITSLQDYLSQLESHAQNINQRLNIIRSNATNTALAWLFTPLQQINEYVGSLTTATKSLSNASSALGSLHLLTTDRSQGLTSLSSSAASIASAFLSAPALVASRVISSGTNTISNLQTSTLSAANQYSSRPVIKTGLNAFNAQLSVTQGLLNSLQDLNAGWQGYDEAVINSAQSLVSGIKEGAGQIGVGSWSSLLGQRAASDSTLSSLNMFLTDTA